MCKSRISNVLAVIMCAFVILSVAMLPGCTQKVTIPQNLEELSLVQIWDTVAKVTHVQNDLVELQSFRLLTGKDKKIDGFTFIFLENDTNGRAKAYQVEINSKGKLDWHSYKSEFPATLHPIEIFTEIDKFNLASLKTGEGGLELQVDFNFSNTGYSSDFLNLYQLENGNLLPLKEIVFRGTPVCVISVFQLQKNQSGSTEVTVTRSEIPTTQIWFLSEDMSKAETVEYLQ
jgi:hypothetical protein